MYDVYHIAFKTNATITDTCGILVSLAAVFSIVTQRSSRVTILKTAARETSGIWDPNSVLAASYSRGTKSTCCRVREALRQDKQKPCIISNGHFPFFS